jgi:hypothetical protein
MTCVKRNSTNFRQQLLQTLALSSLQKEMRSKHFFQFELRNLFKLARFSTQHQIFNSRPVIITPITFTLLRTDSLLYVLKHTRTLTPYTHKLRLPSKNKTHTYISKTHKHTHTYTLSLFHTHFHT